jgi:hypothetical protein
MVIRVSMMKPADVAAGLGLEQFVGDHWRSSSKTKHNRIPS